MSYSFDSRKNRWDELENHYVSMIDELAASQQEEEDFFIPVDEFDELEII